MLENNKKDFSNCGVDLSLISLISNKLRIGIVGAGVGGYIKAKHFIGQGSYIEVLTKEVSKEFLTLKSKNLKIINGEYKKEFILDKHIIIIAVNDKETEEKIKKDCDELYKIYIDSTSFKEGLAALPVQRSLKNIVLGINTTGGNPKGAVMLANKATYELEKYDDFIGFITLVRNSVKDRDDIKSQVLNFIVEDDFFFFFQQGKAKQVLRLFFHINEVQFEN